MYDFLISEYIRKMDKTQIKEFAFKQGIELTSNELEIIYNTIKKNWRTFIYGNPKPILENLKKEVREITYNKIENLYIEARKKYLK